MKDLDGIMIKTHPQFKLLLGLALCVLAINPAQSLAQVWSCAEGYTNHPEGKSNCHRAGAGATCSKDGDRYFAPLRGSEQLGESMLCNHEQRTKSNFLSSDSLDQVSATKGGIYEKFSNSLALAKGYFKNEAPGPVDTKKFRVGDPNYQDVFSCFAGGAGFGECSIAELSSFVENTFMQASEALN